MGNIRNEDHFNDSFWDWSFLNDCFGDTKIRITDIDGLVERNGKFLLIETKMPFAKIPLGQKITHDALLRTGVFAIFIIYGETNKAVALRVMTRGYDSGKKESSNEGVRSMVKRWFNSVNGDTP